MRYTAISSLHPAQYARVSRRFRSLSEHSNGAEKRIGRFRQLILKKESNVARRLLYNLKAKLSGLSTGRNLILIEIKRSGRKITGSIPLTAN
jgi:hypothetical protein